MVSRHVFSFPRSVNEKAARVVAGVVAVTALTALLTEARWLLLPLAYGFWARTLTGPRLSPLALFATRVAAPRLGAPKHVPGPPKRFAQAIGATITTTGTITFALGAPSAADVTLAVLAVAATLESVFALCLGCKMFDLLMRAGLIPEETCAACVDIWSRSADAGPAPAERPRRKSLKTAAD
jgi:Domain of unknown function (DUF4395)